MKESQSDTCVIGAGPAGLAVAEALAEWNLPYTHLDRHTGPGGIWDIGNPGSPMYESAHLISSRTLSGFGGFPMPDHFADYPPHRKILSYLRSFADAWGLTDRIQFGVEAESVEKNADGTRTVTRAYGRESVHGQVVACTGSQWHPNIPELPGQFSGPEQLHLGGVGTGGKPVAPMLRRRRRTIAGRPGCCLWPTLLCRAVLCLREGRRSAPWH